MHSRQVGRGGGGHGLEGSRTEVSGCVGALDHSMRMHVDVACGAEARFIRPGGIHPCRIVLAVCMA